jgi:hypothetical protein
VIDLKLGGVYLVPVRWIGGGSGKRRQAKPGRNSGGEQFAVSHATHSDVRAIIW